MICGVWCAVSKRSLGGDRPDTEFDPSIQDAFWESCKNERDREWEETERALARKKVAAKAEWLRDHDTYLRTPEWRAKRRAVLERDGWVCQGCLKNEAEEVHHLTYDHHKNELLFELTSLCRACHLKVHGRHGEEW